MTSASAAVAGPTPLSPRAVLDAWRGITRSVVRVTFLIGTGYFLYCAIVFAGGNHHGLGRVPGAWLPLFVYAQTAAFALMLCVLVADRVTGRDAKRRGAYVWAVVAGSAAGAIGHSTVVGLVGNVPPSLEVALYLGIELAMLAGGAVFIYLDRRRAQAALARMHAAELERVEASKHMLESRLQAMQARVEPTFLFNTLAQVKALYERDAARGERVLDELIAYLRAAMPKMRDTSSTVGQEIALVHAYLAIARVRMDDRLDFSIDVPDEALDVRLPPMMLLPLVDHALARGQAFGRSKATLRIAAALDHDRLRLTIAASASEFANTGDVEAIAGIGERLAGLYGDRARLTFGPGNDGGTAAIVEIPFEPRDPRITGAPSG